MGTAKHTSIFESISSNIKLKIEARQMKYKEKKWQQIKMLLLCQTKMKKIKIKKRPAL